MSDPLDDDPDLADLEGALREALRTVKLLSDVTYADLSSEQTTLLGKAFAQLLPLLLPPGTLFMFTMMADGPGRKEVNITSNALSENALRDIVDTITRASKIIAHRVAEDN